MCSLTTLCLTKETRSYYFFFCNCSFLHQQPIRNKYFDLPFPNRQDLFQLIRHWLWKRAELRKRNSFLLFFFFCNCSFLHQQRIRNKYFDLPFPNRQDLFQLIRHWLWKRAELSCLLLSKNPFQRYYMVSHFIRADLSCVLKILVAPSTPLIILLFCSWTWSIAIREKGRFVLAKLKTSLSICW